MEIWKPIPGWPNYEASSQGRIRSLGWEQWNQLAQTYSHHKGRVLKQNLSKDGYWLVWLTHEQTGKTLQAHRLICAAFHGKPFEGAECCHANDCRTDNRAENLSWGTRQSNADEMRERHRIKGSRHPRAKLTAFQVFMIRTTPRERFDSRSIAAVFGLPRKYIQNVRGGRNWKWLV